MQCSAHTIDLFGAVAQCSIVTGTAHDEHETFGGHRWRAPMPPARGAVHTEARERNEQLRAGTKNDAGKMRWSLLLDMLGDPVRDVVRALMHGAETYNEDPRDPNYRRVENPIDRFGNALSRHWIDGYLAGEKFDRDSKLPHLAHLVVNALFIMWHDGKEGRL